MIEQVDIKTKEICYHCGENIEQANIQFDEHSFCCTGCSTVYEILKDNNLCNYYDLNENAGLSLKSKNFDDKFDYLNTPAIIDSILDFKSKDLDKVTFYIPSIHCSSCVWLLENFPKIKDGVLYARLDFIKKKLSITYNPAKTNLKEIVELLATLGYEPYISFDNEQSTGQKAKNSNRLIQQIAVVGFCMGNIMLLSFPEYFNIKESSEKQYQQFFLYLNLLLALPVYFFGAWDYIKGSIANIKSIILKETNVFSIDLPIALGITALFVRSIFETFVNNSAGYWDSLAGLVFFLLVGKWVQKRTFDFLGFQRTYKSYFPLAIFVKNKKEYLNISQIEIGDTIVVKNEEIIPTDGIVSQGIGRIDYSFVTGESKLNTVNVGEIVYAGGKHLGNKIEITVNSNVDASYLTQLWNDSAFSKSEESNGSKVSQAFIKYFTAITLGIALVTGVYWYVVDSALMWPTVTAVLMVACPCALTLSLPFTMGTVMGILGKNKFYIRNQEVIQKLQEITDVVFDKTGTLTNTNKAKVEFHSYTEGSHEQEAFALAAQSSHPVSKAISTFYADKFSPTIVDQFEEFLGEGIRGVVNGKEIKLGNSNFCKTKATKEASVFLNIDQVTVGYFTIKSAKRKGLEKLISKIKRLWKIHLLSGDDNQDEKAFEKDFGKNMYFKQMPEQKLKFVENLGHDNRHVLMIGDGLNDAGALQKSHVGIVISEDTNRFSPACDAILDASVFEKLPKFLSFGKAATNIVALSFLLSLVYNFFGIGWAVSGHLSPVLAAIFMPLSSVSVVLFAVGLTYLYALWAKLLNT